MFNDSLGNRDLPIVVGYYMPAEPTAETPIVIVMPGASRDGPRYHSDWVPEAEHYGFLLLVPEFGTDHYPGSVMYNLGNMFTQEQDGDPVDESKWTFTAIEHLFEYVKTATGSTRERFRLYGHSAGSQFVHRFLFFKPNAPVERTVVANAGWYTLPVDTIAWPYGLDGSGRNATDVPSAFAIPTTVLLGDQDIDENQSNLRRTPEAMAQGRHRFERGHTFFEVARDLAEERGWPFAWTIDTVVGANHSDGLMAPDAARILAGG